MLIEITAQLDSLSTAPVRVTLPVGAALPKGPLQLREEGGSLTAPAQREGEYLFALLSGLKAGQKRRFRVEKGPEAKTVSLKEDGPGLLSILLPEGAFTTYHFEAALPRPFFYPVVGPGGRKVTRNYPMQDLAEEKTAKDQDHPHHRSFWTAYGEVNEVDDWSEGKGHGFIKHGKFETRSEGPVFGGFAASGVWTSAEGQPVLDEIRSVRVYNTGPDRRLLDYEIVLTAAHGDVHYGDTKEGGILSFRVFHTMKGAEGGRMENSNGSAGEKECWGKRAAWLDYAGQVEGQLTGIAMMDHPGNLHHPCYWHARDYGLVGTNPFAKSAFEGGD
jgi:hypothetical protein